MADLTDPQTWRQRMANRSHGPGNIDNRPWKPEPYCLACDSFHQLTCDHIVPREYARRDKRYRPVIAARANKQTLCHPCNVAKASVDIIDYRSTAEHAELVALVTALELEVDIDRPWLG